MSTGSIEEDGVQALTRLGLSTTGLLYSTGVERHRERLRANQTDGYKLAQYAADLDTISETASRGGSTIPIDFWDVQSDAMKRVGIDEYELAHTLGRPEFGPYLELLGRAFRLMTDFKQGRGATAVATSLDIMVESARYVRAGHSLQMTETVSRRSREARAILLWEQVVAGTTRSILKRAVYSYGFWERFNVAEMWRYEVGENLSLSTIWGLSGFHNDFVRDPKNTNQIEHIAISAVAQRALGIPLILLDLLEEIEWLTRRQSRPETDADKAANGAVAHHFCRLFSLEDPQKARDSLEQALARGVSAA